MAWSDDAATVHAWAALGGRNGPAGAVSYEGAGGVLASRLPVRELARASVGVCSLAAAELLARRNAVPVPAVRVREAAVATAFTSERRLRIGGRAPTSFAPLSGFWRASDGWVRTHANYPHHRSRLLRALDLDDAGDDRALTEALAARIATRPAREVQETAYAAGGLAVAVAVPSPAAVHPLAEIRAAGGSGPRVLPAAPLPAGGVRVLDLTRVIAGPVATRTLALLGADVLRVDPPGIPEDADSHADTGMGKRSTLLDLSLPEDRRAFDGLLGAADVVVTGYRPGSLDRYGLAPDALLARRPGLIVAQLCAWGWTGPWAGRRGFDSLVQAASGIAAIESAADGRPGVLPAQALDHGTGYLLAAAILRALSDRQLTGEGGLLRLSLAGTASWLLHGVPRAPAEDGSYDPRPWLAETASPYGALRHALPPVAYDGAPRTWSRPPGRWGGDPPAWAGRPGGPG
ncbi:CoA transferase [Planomonospora sp. ID82291]|uniref:CoA transferase n=1 Tax=Planomonospora sp. ID82291 TaxID=2738136 RepID=UPI0018C41451|nr:CoA transferase [Planomonospora sp. ID82291]MBG0816476.1 CoA transferase [Planomonospora sp. ID82291]